MSKTGNSVLRWSATDGIIRYCNGSFSKKCDATPNEIIGKHIDQLNIDNGIKIQHLNELKLIPGKPQTNSMLWTSEDGSEHTELATVQALSEDGQTITEIQINGLEEEQEHSYRIALDALLEVVADNNSIIKDKLQRLLDIGLDNFSMHNGIVGSTMGHSIELIRVCGALELTKQPGDKIPIDGSICSHILKSDKAIAINDVQQSDFSGVCCGIYAELHSVIGTQVVTDNGPLGIICFFSNEVRTQPFTSQDVRLINLIANLVGTIIGNEEQLEFVSQQHDYYQSLFRTVPAMMMLCNSDGLILSTSDLLSDRLGIDPLRIPGKNCHHFFLQSDKPEIDKALNEGDVNQLPLTLCIENGDTLDIELNSRIKHIGSMQGVRMIVLADVTERNQAIKEVEEQNKQLALVNRSLNQFAFIASHDLQEPLRKIHQFCVFLQEDLNETVNDDVRNHMDVIVSSANRMTTLIQDVLAFSSAAKGQLVLRDINLNDLVSDICSELELSIAESNARIDIDELPTIQGDSSLVRQLFANLISNSIKYREDNRDPEINIASQCDGNTLKITVTDNGIGFDQKLVTRAFEPFNRLHTDKKYKGNGIGLSICATVCEKHDWKLSAESSPGSGSVFAIEIKPCKSIPLASDQ